MKKLIISCLFVVFCLGAEFMFSAPAVFEPGVPVTVDTTLAYSYAKVPYKDALLMTKEILRRKALITELGKGISLEDLVARMQPIKGVKYNQALAESIFFASSAGGYIISEEVLKDTKQALKGDKYRLKMIYKANVLPAAKAKPSALGIRTELSNPNPKAGEEVTLSCTPAVDGYLFIFAYRADGKASLLYPPDEGKNLIKKNSQKNVVIKPYLPQGKAEGYYTILVIFSQTEIPGWRKFLTTTEAPDHLFSTSGDGYGLFKSWLPTYDSNLRSEQFFQLHIGR